MQPRFKAGYPTAACIDDRRFARSEAVHIDSEELLRIGLVS